MSNSPLFIHATFRTCSTWWWAQLRDVESVTAFYEPLHPNLEDRTHEACDQSHHGKDKAALYRHPSVPHHYFSEYPLREEGGLASYLSRFAFDNYAMQANEQDAELTSHITSLITLAQEQDTRPALKFNRTTLRGAWVKAQFGGDHIYLNRSPQSIMNSIRSFLRPKDGEVSNADFGAFFLAIVGQNSEHPIFAEAAQEYGLQKIENVSLGEAINQYKHKALTMPDQDLQDIVGFVWFTGLVHASSYADLIADQELMADTDYRQDLQKRIQSDFSINISLDGFKPHSITEPEFTISIRMQNIMAKAVKYIPHDIEKIQVMKISQDSKRHLNMALTT